MAYFRVSYESALVSIDDSTSFVDGQRSYIVTVIDHMRGDGSSVAEQWKSFHGREKTPKLKSFHTLYDKKKFYHVSNVCCCCCCCSSPLMTCPCLCFSTWMFWTVPCLCD